ncbi:GntR family transcriptional regulator [Lentisphaera marina]|uniref:GntR family transcriptional regulator n=1 Tax=Lentisphaera marina TaxID=1111041 RepID=UPI00236614CA|nr:GntR family transcriptional regulator [Lentisphaera marina]MDD7983906.1 GntR family transcriptional regulator [Lentisphaera marina]
MPTPKKRLGQKDVSQIIKERIIKGDFSTAGLLPPLRTLATAIGSSRHTIWNAVSQLCEEQYLISNEMGRYKVHPRFIFGNKGDAPLNLLFASQGKGYLEDPLEAKIFQYLCEHQEGLKITSSLSAQPAEYNASVKDFSGYNATILAAPWAQKIQPQLKTQEIANVALNPALGTPYSPLVRIDYFHYGELAGQQVCGDHFTKLVVVRSSNENSSIEQLYYLGLLKAWLRAGKLERNIKTIAVEKDLFQRLASFKNELQDSDDKHAFILFSPDYLPELHNVLAKQEQWFPQAVVAIADQHPSLDELSVSSIGSDIKAFCTALIQQLRRQDDLAPSIIPGKVITRNSPQNLLGSDLNA